MTKREIINWLKEKKAETKLKVRERYAEIRHNSYDDIYNKLGMKKFEEQLNERLVEIQKDYKEKFTGRKFFIRDLSNTIDYSTLKSNENKLLNEVENNYNIVIYNVQRMSTAKIAIEYLKTLGIELPKCATVEEPVTALAKPVDVRYLFLANNEGENNDDN